LEPDALWRLVMAALGEWPDSDSDGLLDPVPRHRDRAHGDVPPPTALPRSRPVCNSWAGPRARTAAAHAARLRGRAGPRADIPL
jgi:hypothetical protein